MTDMTSAHATGFRCLRCGQVSPYRFPAYRCQECGGNLAVTYDLEAIGAQFVPPTAEQREALGHFAYGAFLPVEAELGSRFDLPVGPSPLVEAPGLAAKWGVDRLWFKDDTRLPSGSFKDRASSVVVRAARQNGVKIISTASTGNAGCSLACMCAREGLTAVVFVPKLAPPGKVAQLLAYGAVVVQVDGRYDDAFDLCFELSRERGWFNRSTGWNPLTREGKKTVSFEICDQLGWSAPELVVVPVGDGNIISGTWKGFAELRGAGVVDTTPRLLAVQSTQSNAVSLAFGRSNEGVPQGQWVQGVDATTRADSISVDVPRDGEGAVLALRESHGDVIEVEDREILAAIPQMASETGIFPEPAASAAFAGLRRWLEKVPAKERPRTVVVLVTGNGLKDIGATLDSSLEAVQVPNNRRESSRILDEVLQSR